MRASGKYLLDTSIAVAILRNAPSVIQASSQAAELFISAIALGELYYGAYHSANRESNLQAVKQFAQTCSLLRPARCCQSTTRLLNVMVS
ncbi:MAG: PIN domain-containing protein [Armatimonadota bacterium]